MPLGIPVAGPVAQTMARSGDWRELLAPSPGVLMRERISLMQFLCGACEKRISYAAGQLPAQPDPAAHPHMDDEVFMASLTPGLFEIREESTCCCRYCCHQNRELKLGLFAARANMPGNMMQVDAQGSLFGGLGWPEGEVPSLQLLRPFKCTMPCCCCLLQPQEMNALDTATNASLGGTQMDWSCWLCIAPCLCVPRLRYNVLDEQGKPEFQVHVPACFADGGLNCCAPTCFNKVFSMPITYPNSELELGSIQSHWPGCNVRGLCCGGNANNNYAVIYPPSATPEQKARLLSAVHLVDLNLFERRGNQNQ